MHLVDISRNVDVCDVCDVFVAGWHPRLERDWLGGALGDESCAGRSVDTQHARGLFGGAREPAWCQASSACVRGSYAEGLVVARANWAGTHQDVHFVRKVQ